MVTDADDPQYIFPRWTIDPETAECNVRDVPRPSRAALWELHGLDAMILQYPGHRKQEFAMRHRRRKTLQRKLPVAPPLPLRISLPKTVNELAVSSLAELITAVMRQPDRTPRD